MASISKRASGAWQNTSYGIRGTATDTITTLPTTIYSDGTNATVSIKGNTSQSGTPTPSNPVPVVGVGELETTGKHSGEYKIPILSADITTNNYLGEVESTRRIEKLVLTGEELWQKSNTYQGSFYSPQALINCALQGLICTHAEYTPVINATEYIYGKCTEEGSGVNKTLDLYLGDSSWTAADFKTYLAQQYAAGTPVTVWYVLATPKTAVINEPLMRIGDYADEVSGVSIPTADGANTLSVDTTVQPSEVSVNYHGWHMGTVHERTAGQWD